MKKAKLSLGDYTLNRRIFLRHLSAVGLSSALIPGSAMTMPPFNSEINVENLKAAEAVFDIEFTDDERNEVLDGVVENKEKYKRFREQHLDYYSFPSMVFNPLLPGVKLNHDQRPLVFTRINITRPGNFENVAFYSVLQLAELLRTNQVTSVELTKLFLARLKKFNGMLKFVVNYTEDLALKQAKKADKEIQSGNYKGLLHGIPYGIKDLFSVKGYKTTWGAKVFEDRVIDFDAAVVEKLEAAGAVLLAKLSTGTLASGEKWFGGATKSPWTLKNSGGSSAGPASAVAAGCMPFSIGTETNGSMVSPVAGCGVTGLRPTFGRISRYGCMPVSWSFDKVTPIARTVEDCALIFSEIQGSDLYDNSVIDAPFNWDKDFNIRDLKIGYHATHYNKMQKGIELDSESKSWFELRIPHVEKVFDHFTKQGFDLVPLDFTIPHIGEGIMMLVEAAAAFDEFTRGNSDDLVEDQKWPRYHRTHRFVPAVEYLQAARYRQKMIQKMDEIMKDVDVYVEVTWSTNYSTNVTGLPIVVVPCGFTSRNFPISVTFVGKPFQEEKVLAVAKAFQDATDYHNRKPKFVQ